MASFISRTGVFHSPDHLRQTLMALNDQRNLSQFCDVVLRVSNTQIYAHSNVLAAASPYFESFLGIGADCPRVFSQKHPQIIEIHIDTKDEDNSYGEAVSKVVEFMYTSQIILTPTLVFQVVEIGKIMQMYKLLEFCELFQRGDDSNYPIDIATCTTGLMEIANLLGSRSRTIKQVSVSTETEDMLFKKIEMSTLAIAHTESLVYETDNQTKQEDNQTVEDNSLNQNSIVSPDNTANDFESGEQDTEISDMPEAPIGFDTDSIDQNDASLLLAISNVRLPANLTQPENDRISAGFPKQNDISQHFQTNSEICLHNDNSPQVISFVEEDNSGVEVNTAVQDIAVESQCTSKLRAPEEFIQTNSQANKDFNLDDISDLLKFDSMTSLFQSSRGLGRGRPRGRGRGRGRKRRPGRPRKIKEEPDSDQEFEAFIDRVEKGESSPHLASEDVLEDNIDVKIKPDLDVDDTTSIKDKSHTMTEGEADEGKRALNWKSRRRRLKPSQLRKDYVMHSLSKKTRKQHDEPKSERLRSSQTLDPKLESVATLTNVQLVCQKCDFSTVHFKDYRQHMKTHPETDPRYFLCDKCQFKTTKAREFNTHKHKHLKEELICSLCSYQSNNMNDFEKHSQKHAGDSPYFCTECDSRFKTKNQLIAHKPKHQLEKPFVCAICNSGFKWKHALKNHMITHSATKDHLCDVCGYATAHKSQLKAHKLIHTGHMFKCPMQGCNFEATKRQNLKYHMVTHTHEKPHQCDVCGQSFSLIKNMRRHMLLHTDTRPFSCKICSFSTTRYDKLKEHNLKLHNIGEPSTSKKDVKVEKECEIENIRLINSSITYVSPEGITINTDGAITEETLQRIAHLASSQGLGSAGLQGATINIEQTAEDGTVYPIIATVQSFTDSNGEIQYIAEVPD